MYFEGKSPKINKENLMDIFTTLNKMLNENMLNVDLYLYGGSYMTLISDSRPATRDIDCLFNATNDIIFKNILLNIKEIYGLEEDWLNNEIAEPLKHLSKEEIAIFKKYSNLNIYVPSQQQMLAMKILASRPYPAKDFDDAYILCKNLNITTRQELMNIVKKFIDLKYLGERQLNFIKYLGKDLGYDW
jgi:hypothetical protein